jgi:hypothetical protein
MTDPQVRLLDRLWRVTLPVTSSVSPGIASLRDDFASPGDPVARIPAPARESGQGSQPGRVICSTRSWKIRHRRSFSWVSTELVADRSAAWLISSAAAYR